MIKECGYLFVPMGNLNVVCGYVGCDRNTYLIKCREDSFNVLTHDKNVFNCVSTQFQLSVVNLS